MLPQEHFLEDSRLLLQRNTIVHELQRRSSTVAISVWGATVSPDARRLLYYNDSYKDLCDVVSFGEGRLEDCLPSGVFFTTALLEERFHYAMQATMEKFNLVISGKTNFASMSDGYHLSKLGRLQPVCIEWYLLTLARKVPCQVLIAEFINNKEKQLLDKNVAMQRFRVKLDTWRWTNWGAEDGHIVSLRKATSYSKCQVCNDSLLCSGCETKRKLAKEQADE